MTCIKTGARVYFPEYNCQVAADLYLVDNVDVVRFYPEQWQQNFTKEGATHHAFTEGGFWRPDLGILVASDVYGGLIGMELKDEL